MPLRPFGNFLPLFSVLVLGHLSACGAHQERSPQASLALLQGGLPSLAQSANAAPPACKYGKASDPDGDGWGWEEGHSCRVTEAPATVPDLPPPGPIAKSCLDPHGAPRPGVDLVAGHCVERSSSYYVHAGQVYHQGSALQLRGVNWFGFEGSYMGLHGLWTGRSLASFVDQMQELGFNALRIPLAPEIFDPARGGKDGYATPLAQLYKLLDYSASKGLHVVLDLQNCSMNNDSLHKPAPGLGECSAYSEEAWIKDLQKLARIAAVHPNVVGIDLFNEPYGLTWPAWRAMAERASAAVLTTNPRLLIFLEGVGNLSTAGGDSAFWGENFYAARQDWPQIEPSRLVYSPHVYGPSVANMDYFHAPNYPANLPAIWDRHFGFLKERGVTMVYGEFGGTYKGDDQRWQDAFVDYMQDSQTTSYFYWSMNPNAGDTHGLLLDDWRSVDTGKLKLLRRLVPAPSLQKKSPSRPLSGLDVGASRL